VDEKKPNERISRMNPISQWFGQLTQDGYALLPGVFTSAEVESARESCAHSLSDPEAASSLLVDEAGQAYGARNVLRLWPGAVRLARSPRLAAPLLRILGADAGIVRGLYFDKPPGSSWALPWHRDLTIAVKQHGRMGRFKKPTTKAGVPHLVAPVEFLSTMLTARIHLDQITLKNGPLRVIPGSHRPDASKEGNDPNGECQTGMFALSENRNPVIITCNAGDVLLMRPLLMHASGHSEPDHPGHRRIVHLELAPVPQLPDSYDWHAFVRIQETVLISSS
jgi:hypothetical protein